MQVSKVAYSCEQQKTKANTQYPRKKTQNNAFANMVQSSLIIP